MLKAKGELIRASAILMALLLLLCACSKQSGDNPPPKDPEANGSNIEVKEPDAPSPGENIFDWAKGNEKSSFSAYTVRMNNLQYHVIDSSDRLNESSDEPPYHRIDLIIEGLKDKSLEEEINAKIISQVNEFADLKRVPDVPGIKALQAQGLDPAKFRSKEVYVIPYCNMGNILSLAVYSSAYYELDDKSSIPLSECKTFNIDLNSGKEIRISDLFADDVDGMKYLNDAVNEAIRKIGTYDNPFINIYFDEDYTLSLAGTFTGLKENQKYYLNGDNGNLVLIFDKETPEFHSKGGVSLLQIDIAEVAAFDRFIFEGESIYASDELVYNLIQRPLRADMNLSSFDKYDAIPEISGAITINSPVYKELTEAQQRFISFSDEDIAEMKNTFTEKTESFRRQYAVDTTMYEGFLNSYGLRYGNYLCLSRNESHYLSRTDIWIPLFSDASYETRCYKIGQDEPLKIEDIFKDPANWKEKLAPAIAKSALNYFGPSSSTPLNPDLMLQMGRDLLDYCTGFSMTGDSLRFSYSPPEGFLYDYLPADIEFTEDYAEDYYFASQISFADIGCEHLNIF